MWATGNKNGTETTALKEQSGNRARTRAAFHGLFPNSPVFTTSRRRHWKNHIVKISARSYVIGEAPSCNEGIDLTKLHQNARLFLFVCFLIEV